jgi:hypothetical protein
MDPPPGQSRVECQRWMKSAVELAGAIEGCGIPVVVLKGPVLAERIYPDPAARAFSDIDL